MDVIAERLRHSDLAPAYDTSSSWPPARTPGSGYARLLEWMVERLGQSEPADITAALLDGLGAPTQPFDWPVDCLLRPLQPGSSPVAVLDRLAPAGILDARFIPAMVPLYGGVPHAEAYRDFLARLECHTGVEFVELLAPPLSEAAANAVRRPLYTRAWTGDADIETYCDPDGSATRYIPPSHIHLRRAPKGLVAEVASRPIWPVYHATRYPSPPWNLIAELLNAAAPRPARWFRRLHHCLDLVPERGFVPRVTVGGTLVLSCAQWRITPDTLWDPAESLLQKARALERLRRRLGLPRWVFAAAGPATKPLACDLESLRSIRLLERLAPTGPSPRLVLEEMLPSPQQLLVQDGAHTPEDRLAAELLLRFPCDESPSDMATRLAADLGRQMIPGVP